MIREDVIKITTIPLMEGDEFAREFRKEALTYIEENDKQKIELERYKRVYKKIKSELKALNINLEMDWGIMEDVAYIEEGLKESMKKLERLEKFKNTFDKYKLAKKQDFISYENWQECEKELEKYQAITLPTEKYVCEVLSKVYENKVEYDNQHRQFYYKNQRNQKQIVIDYADDRGVLFIKRTLPEHIELVAKFYKGEKK